jgi:hypothetical protein
MPAFSRNIVIEEHRDLVVSAGDPIVKVSHAGVPARLDLREKLREDAVC